MRCCRNFSSHLSRCISQPEARGVWCAVLSSLSHVAQEQGFSAPLIWQHLALVMSVKIGINLWCFSKNGWFGLQCASWSVLHRELESLSLFHFSGWRGSFVDESPVTWLWLKTGRSAFLWGRPGFDTMPGTPTVMWSLTIRQSVMSSFSSFFTFLISCKF